MKYDKQINTFFSVLKKTALIIGALLLFIFAIELVKTGITSGLGSQLYELIETHLSSPSKAFLAAYLGGIVTLSGSTVAALGVSLSAVGFMPPDTLWDFILGSRGAPNIPLFIVGFVALTKRKTIYRSLGLGVIEYMVTLTVIFGSYCVRFLPFVDPSARTLSTHLKGLSSSNGIFDVLYKPIIELIIELIGGSISFVVGIVLLILAIKLFDTFFSFLEFEKKDDREVRQKLRGSITTFFLNPVSTIRSSLLAVPHRIKRLVHPTFEDKLRKNLIKWITHPVISFSLGLLVTALTMSNAVSVTLIFPFYLYKAIDIRAAVPYILGANISTYIDTLVLAIFSGSEPAIHVLLVAIITSTHVAIIYGLFFKLYLFGLSVVTHKVFTNNYTLIGTLVGMVLIPLGLIYVL